MSPGCAYADCVGLTIRAVLPNMSYRYRLSISTFVEGTDGLGAEIYLCDLGGMVSKTTTANSSLSIVKIAYRS